MSARDEILGRIRSALADRAAVPEVGWVYGRPVDAGDDAVDRFIERTAEYRAGVQRVGPDSVSAAEAATISGRKKNAQKKLQKKLKKNMDLKLKIKQVLMIGFYLEILINFML